MKKQIFYISCFFLIAIHSQLISQQNIFFKSLLKKDGLSQSSVFSITQDSSGLIWLGTRDGLNMYDGYGFTIFKNKEEANSIVANDVRTLYYDHATRLLWIGTSAGLSRYNTVTHIFDNYRHTVADETTISSNSIREILRDSSGLLWVATSAGLDLMDEISGTFTSVIPTETYNGEWQADVNTLCETIDGELLIGTDKGLYKITSAATAGQYELSPVISPFENQVQIQSMISDAEGTIWIGTQKHGLIQWQPKKNNNFSTYLHNPEDPNSLSHDNIRDICLDANNNLWVGTFNGLNLLHAGENNFIRYSKTTFGSNGLSDKSIRSLFKDKQGSLWVGTYYGGVNILDSHFMPSNQDFSPIYNALKGNVVSSFAEDAYGHLWVGTEGNGLKFLDKNGRPLDNAISDRINSALTNTNVKNVFLDNDDLWVGTFQRGLHRFGLNSDKHTKYTADRANSISSDNIYGILEKDDRLWLLAYGSGLDVYDKAVSRFYNYDHDPDVIGSLSSSLSRCILETQDGQLWIGTEGGLNKVIVGQDGLPESFVTYISHEKIYCLAEDAAGFILIGTFDNGLYKFDHTNGILKHYTTSDGLPSNTILGIVEAANGKLWVSTSDGLSVFNPIQKTFSSYKHPSIADNSEYNYNAYYRSSEGSILFGGVNGYTQFSPDLLTHNNYVPPIVLTGLKRNNKLIEVGDDTGLLTSNINDTESITFNYDQANFTISFAALDYFSPESNHYATYMEGIDNDWNYSIGESEATYTIQKEGTYLFKIKGGNNEGVFNPEVRALEIIVRPPMSRTWWAYLLYLVLGSLVLFAVVRYFSLNSKLQLEKIANLQQEELHEVKMRFYTNITHEFRTPLTMIVAPVNDLIRNHDLPAPVMSKLHSINRNAGRMLNLANQILNFRRLDKDHISLKITKGDFNVFLHEIFLMFTETAIRRNISYDYHPDNKVQLYFDQDKLEKVFYNILSNAFKFTPDGGRILLRVESSDSHVHVSIQDSGAGVQPDQLDQIFKRFYEKSDKATSRIKGTGIGLAISKKMVELHHGRIELKESTAELEGAHFRVSLPFGQAHFNIQDIKHPVIEYSETVGQSSIFDNHSKPLLENGNLATIPAEISLSNEAFHLLIVEDNEEIRGLLVEMFRMNYKVSTAINGAEALEKIKTEPPDLIISDVMMPVMDGITFCQNLKSNLEFSHLPVLLLTARTASLYRIEGLKNGADDYLTKPFIPEELKLRVKNILRSRKEMKEKFVRLLNFDPKEINLTSRDELFIERAIEIVEDNMDNTAFNVNSFASLIAVSRPLLFTKLKALSGQTPNNFIKTIRLKRAAQLIKTNKFSVTEVAHHVGFNDVKYFGKCFKQQFGSSPTKYNNA